MDLRLLIFDLDGTLIDSEQDLVIAVNATREQAGLPPLEMAEVARMVGRGAAELVRRALGALAGDDHAFRRYLEYFVLYYRRHALEHTRLYPGVEDTVAELRARGYLLAVLTNKPVRISRDILVALKLAPHLRFIYGAKGPLPGPPHPDGIESFDRKKPDPIGILTMLRKTGLGPRQAMMVGDSAVDILTGRNAQVWTCGVTYGFQPETLRETSPDWVVGSLPELATRLANLKITSPG
jgi:phosphoglycolate phosphatase